MSWTVKMFCQLNEDKKQMFEFRLLHPFIPCPKSPVSLEFG